MKSFVFIFAIMLPFASVRAESPTADSGSKATQRVAFSQSCFWTGEMKLGQIDGVVRTEAGFFQGREVTLVDYDSSRISLEKLAGEARQAGVADRVHLPADAKPAAATIAGVNVGAPLDRTYRVAPASDQKKQLEGTPYAPLKLSAEQATKVNAFARSNPARAMEWLGSAQRASLASSQ